MTNNVNISITAADDTAIKAAIATLQQKLNPKLLALTDADRRGGIKMGDKSIAFVQKAVLYGNQFSTQLPPSIDMAALTVDVNTVTQLNGYLTQLAILARGLEDTMILAGAEAMEASNLVYGALKFLSHSGVAGTQEAINDMKQRYTIKSTPAHTTPPTP